MTHFVHMIPHAHAYVHKQRKAVPDFLAHRILVCVISGEMIYLFEASFSSQITFILSPTCQL
jgi:hypothetical protein